ncbi:hypothetical protein AC1031_001518 [Aphanomyces cochlioides]|nr:hypothetical protein AC1031_001518 [Aphanomyces cochlioides]
MKWVNGQTDAAGPIATLAPAESFPATFSATPIHQVHCRHSAEKTVIFMFSYACRLHLLPRGAIRAKVFSFFNLHKAVCFTICSRCHVGTVLGIRRAPTSPLGVVHP